MDRWQNLASNLALAALFVAGLAYLLVAVVRVDPTADPMTVTVRMSNSGGLLDRSEVTYRGVEVGRVHGIRLEPGGVAVDLRIYEDARIPADSQVRVAGLSVAGEQYIDFRPRSDGGPYLADGMVIGPRGVDAPTHFAQLLANLSRLAEQADPDKIRLIFDEVSTAVSGSASDLRTILDGSDQLLGDLENVLPETLRILRNGESTVDMVVDLRDELRRLGKSGKVIGRELTRADPDLRALLEQSPQTLELVDSLLTDIQPETEAVLADLADFARVAAPRDAALRLFFPELDRTGAMLSKVADGGLLRVVVDLWPKLSCDYGTPQRPPTEGGWPAPRLDAQCTQVHPELQQRGSYNSPRPADDPSRPGQGGSSESTRAAPDARTQPPARTGTPQTWYDHYLQRLGVA